MHPPIRNIPPVSPPASAPTITTTSTRSTGISSSTFASVDHQHPSPSASASPLGTDQGDADTSRESYDDEQGRAGYLTEFHEESARTWIISSVIIAVLVAIVSHFRFSLAISISILGIGVFTTRRSVEQLKKDFIWETERRSHSLANIGEGKNGPRKNDRAESVEWLNEVIRQVWPVVSPELFVAGVDLLEDALKSLSPAIVNSVKVSSLEQGTNPLRLLGIQYLPADADITLPPNHIPPTASQAAPPSFPSKSFPTKPEFPAISGHRDDEEPGSYVNLEAEFSFRRLPPSSSTSHSSQSAGISSATSPHFLLQLGVGLVKKLVKFQVPVWVELVGLHGKCRLRLQIISDPPFVGRIQFCFTRLPAIEIVAKPMSSLSIDIMNFPGISPFILSSINTVINHFVAPASYTIELSKFLLGSEIVMKTKSIGVICLVIHSATRLSSTPATTVITTSANAAETPPTSVSSTTTSSPPSSRASFLAEVNCDTDTSSFIGSPVVPIDNPDRRDSTVENTSEEGKKCHPFVNISYSHIGKVLYTTRVLDTSHRSSKSRIRRGKDDEIETLEEEEWEWEEMVFVRVALEDIEDDESLRLTVLDADISAVDDGVTIQDHERVLKDEILGHLDISLHHLRSTPGIFENGNEALRSLHRGVGASGRVSFSAAFFPLARSTPLRSEPLDGAPLGVDASQATPSSTSAGVSPVTHSFNPHDEFDSSPLEKDAVKEKGKGKKEKEKHRPMFADRSQNEGGSRSAAYAQRMREMLDGRIAANASQKSGILSYQVHQLSELVSSSRMQSGRSKYKTKESILPSSYVRVLINEEFVLKTAVKPFSAAPYLNAESEYFLRDWTKARVDFVVMDSIEDDHDTVIGSISLELRDLLSKKSQSTSWYTLSEGRGTGRIRLSLLFKPIDIMIEPCLRDWNVGALAITDLSAVALDSACSGKVHLEVDGGGRYDTAEVPAAPWANYEVGSLPRFELNFSAAEEHHPIRLGVLNRSSAYLAFQLSTTTPSQVSSLTTSGLTTPSTAEAVYWLSSLSEGGSTKVVLPLYEVDSQHPPFSRSALPLPSMPIRRLKQHRTLHHPFGHSHPHIAPATILISASHSLLHDGTPTAASTYSTFAKLSEMHHTHTPQHTPARKIGIISFTIAWSSGFTELHRPMLGDDMVDLLPLFLRHPRSNLVSQSTNVPDDRRTIRLPEDDGMHDHSHTPTSTANSSAGGRRSGEYSRDSSRRSSFAGSGDERPGSSYGGVRDDAKEREKSRKNEKERGSGGWVKNMTRKMTHSSKSRSE